MPHLVQMDRRYRKKGLQIFGAEVQGSSKESIQKITKEFRVKFPITKGVSGPRTGSGIPRTVVFDTSGKLVFAGHPQNEDFERSIKAALKDAKNEPKPSFPQKSSPLIAKRTWTNQEGKKIIAEVLKIEEDQVQFKLPNGKKVMYNITRLSEEDQKLIANTKKEKTADAK